MPDFRNSSDPLYRDPDGPIDGTGYEPAGGDGTSWAWIAGAFCLVVIVVLAFAVGHEPRRMASNDMTPSAATRLAPSPPAADPAAPRPGLVAPPASSRP
jgi:hypothetical protein